jgi:hypothetical protein
MDGSDVTAPELALRQIIAADEACLARFFVKNNLQEVVRHLPFSADCRDGTVHRRGCHREKYYGAFLADCMVGTQCLGDNEAPKNKCDMRCRFCHGPVPKELPGVTFKMDASGSSTFRLSKVILQR